MANSGGGYILIGVREINENSTGFFAQCKIPQPLLEALAASVGNRIEPPIQGLEVKDRSLQWDDKDITLVIVHIPLSISRPHGFQIAGCYQFRENGTTPTLENIP